MIPSSLSGVSTPPSRPSLLLYGALHPFPRLGFPHILELTDPPFTDFSLAQGKSEKSKWLAKLRASCLFLTPNAAFFEQGACGLFLVGGFTLAQPFVMTLSST